MELKVERVVTQPNLDEASNRMNTGKDLKSCCDFCKIGFTEEQTSDCGSSKTKHEVTV